MELPESFSWEGRTIARRVKRRPERGLIRQFSSVAVVMVALQRS